MQLGITKHIVSFTLLSLLACNTAMAEEVPAPTLNQKIALGLIYGSVLTVFVRLVTKKTQPVRVEPASDSLNDFAWYAFDELLVGQIEKGERPSEVYYDEEKDAYVIKYSKIEARGVAGTIYSSMKPVIIPAATLLLLFNTDLKKKFKETLRDFYTLAGDPRGFIADIFTPAKS